MKRFSTAVGGWLTALATAMALLQVAPPAAAQVTTGSLSGLVLHQSQGPLPGVRVTAIHTPTGTTYVSTTQADGSFRIPNVRVGGPYTVSTQLSGFKEATQEGLVVQLGEDTYVPFKLELAGISETVTVTAESSPLISPTRAGTTDNLGSDVLEALPTLSRSVQDFARTNPLFTQSASNDGPSFITVAGRNNRYNSITIDGAVNNDLFGLAATGTPGGQSDTQPISLDSVQEVQLLVSPYDVRQGGFSGGGLNAITRSGTNRLNATTYYYFRNDSFVGNGIDNKPLGPFDDKQVGASLGGPLVQDRAFFFTNVDLGRRSTPSGWSISGSGSQWGHEAEAAKFLSILQNQYGFDPGGTSELERTTNNDKVFVRFDFNLNAHHRLVVRDNFVNARNDIGSISPSRYIFPDAFYNIKDKTNSFVAQLNSSMGGGFNELRATYQTIRDRRAGDDSFPQVTVLLPNNDSLRAGTEEYSTANRLDQDILELTDDFTLIKGAHTFLIGTHNELFSFDNLFIRDNYGAYQFSSLNTLEAGFAQQYDYSFSATSNPEQSAKFGVNQLGFYVGDTWSATSNVTLIGGLRADIPLFPDKPTHNAEVQSLFGIDTSEIPSGKILWSPRLGFNWDVRGDGNSQVRGGLGSFSGRTPYVWISNQYSNTGLEFTRIGASYNVDNQIPFVADPFSQPTQVIGAQGRAFTNEVNLIDPNFKFPSVLRFNLAYDQKIGGTGLVGTVELNYGKTLNDIDYKNLNLEPTGEVLPGGRPVLAQVDRTYSSAILLTNTTKGSQWNATARLERPLGKGFYFTTAYTYGRSKSVNDGTSSQASSNWRYQPTVDPNARQLSTSLFDIRHRINLGVSRLWRFNDRGLGVRLSVYYNGQSGRPYSTIYRGDANGDFNWYDLIYVPASADEVIITNGTWQDLDTYISNDPGLDKARGSIVERNASRGPWTNFLDLRSLVDVPLSRTKLQLSLDVFNVLNLINSDWGQVKYAAYDEVSPISYGGVDAATGKMIYDLSPISGGDFQKFSSDDLRSRWQLQLGARLSF